MLAFGTHGHGVSVCGRIVSHGVIGMRVARVDVVLWNSCCSSTACMHVCVCVCALPSTLHHKAPYSSYYVVPIIGLIPISVSARVLRCILRHKNRSVSDGTCAHRGEREQASGQVIMPHPRSLPESKTLQAKLLLATHHVRVIHPEGQLKHRWPTTTQLWYDQ